MVAVISTFAFFSLALLYQCTPQDKWFPPVAEFVICAFKLKNVRWGICIEVVAWRYPYDQMNQNQHLCKMISFMNQERNRPRELVTHALCDSPTEVPFCYDHSSRARLPPNGSLLIFFKVLSLSPYRSTTTLVEPFEEHSQNSSGLIVSITKLYQSRTMKYFQASTVPRWSWEILRIRSHSFQKPCKISYKIRVKHKQKLTVVFPPDK